MAKTQKLKAKGLAVVPMSQDVGNASVSSLPSALDLEVSGEPVAVLTSVTSDFSELSGKYRDKIHHALAIVYAVALFFGRNESAWQDFCRNEGWKDFKGKPPTVLGTADKLKPTVRFAVGLSDPSASKTASKYYAALAYAYQMKLPAEEIPSYLADGGGIEKLAAKSAEMRRAGFLDLDGEPRLCIAADLDDVSRALLSSAENGTIKVKLTVLKSDGIGQLEVKIVQVAEAEKPKHKSAKKAA